MLYQSYYVRTETVTCPPFIDGDEPTMRTVRRIERGELIEAVRRDIALRVGRTLYGVAFDGLTAEGVSCQFCEDRGGIPHALTGAPCDCPRCGR